jgi:hypothetical protein
MSNLKVLVVDLDLSMIGAQYINFTQHLNGLPGQLNWTVVPSTNFSDMAAIKNQVSLGNYWGAVVVQPNASSNLNRAFVTPLPDYDPTNAFAFIYDGGRDPLVVRPYIVANMYTQFLQFSKIFNPQWIKVALVTADQYNISTSDLAAAPQVLGTPVAFQEFDLHPPTASIITSATTVAYIWIFLVAGGSTYLVAHLIQPMTKNATVIRTVVSLLGPLLGFLMSLSMAYSLLLLAFGVPFNSASQFLSLFSGMLVLQCAVASMVIFLIYLIPVIFIPSFTITFVILNVIAVFNPVELMPAFYRWVYAMPFLNGVQIARFVLMGSFNRLKFNIPILFAWVMVPIWRQKRLARKLAEDQELQLLQQQQRHHQLKLQQAQGNNVGEAEGEEEDKVDVLSLTDHQKFDLDEDDDQDTLSDVEVSVHLHGEGQGHRHGPAYPNMDHHGNTNSYNSSRTPLQNNNPQGSRDKTRDATDTTVQNRPRNLSPRKHGGSNTRPPRVPTNGGYSSRTTSHHHSHPSTGFSDENSSEDESQTYYYQPPPPPVSRSQHRSQQQRPSRVTTKVEPSAPSESLVFGRSSDRGRRGRGGQVLKEVK